MESSRLKQRKQRRRASLNVLGETCGAGRNVLEVAYHTHDRESCHDADTRGHVHASESYDHLDVDDEGTCLHLRREVEEGDSHKAAGTLVDDNDHQGHDDVLDHCRVV